MTVIAIDTPRSGYSRIRQQVTAGRRVSPRGAPTREKKQLIIRVSDPTDNDLFVDATMTDWMRAEVNSVIENDEPQFEASEELIEKLDLKPDGTFFESGVRQGIGGNWSSWVSRLREDPDTRKVAATFTSPEDTDPPCTMSIQLMLRDGALYMTTFNRSQDIDFAFKMDCGLFGEVIERMADDIGCEVGRWTHVIGSAHLYEEDI